jgi:hypothetical protein
MSENWFYERAVRICYEWVREGEPARLACGQWLFIEVLAHELEQACKEAQVLSAKEFRPGWPKRC